MKKFLSKYTNLYNPLVMSCSNKTDDANLAETLDEFNKHLNYFGLEDKTLIAVNFPRNDDEIEQLKSIPVEPNRVILLKTTEKRETTCNENIFDSLAKTYPQQTKQFYGDKNTVEELCKKVRRSLEYSEPVLKSKLKWLPRVCLMGARGSGAKLQAKLLTKNCNLVYGKSWSQTIAVQKIK